MQETCDVAIIGGGPAGAIAAAKLAARGWHVEVFESQHFPRFSIGESLLPTCMIHLEEVGLEEEIAAHGFQFKDGAVFWRNHAMETIDFREKSAAGPATVYQVRRDQFDEILIRNAGNKGAHLHFGHKVTGFEPGPDGTRIQIEDEAGDAYELTAKFTLDASGFGRVLPRLLDLDVPSEQTSRRSCFKHVYDHADHPGFDRNKILITVHPDDPQVWLWLIPLADGVSSIGVVGEDAVIRAAGETPDERLASFVASSGFMAEVLKNATEARPAQEIVGYSKSVKSLIGERYALLGNAAEFLDPVFSSGVAIAMKSASLAADLVDRQLQGETVDWSTEFVSELKVGVEAFRACVNAWYTGLLQQLIFFEDRNVEITRNFTSILAGYAWDRKNPIVQDPRRFFSVMEKLTSA